ncbi:hypothetical protein BB560_005560 [Smittium megazygosporum]|uniref:PWWP domain-containing protein n=1 Tax=Smittium megazygosporum TaxID=133381 RepID=A0A2T9YNA7_9FUNG|nr:hypothetical protein BB560_005983 [Smittium megazygosporum]PVU99093.1 hypothetical protein BB560_005560 [Smittium megazygosporum]
MRSSVLEAVHTRSHVSKSLPSSKQASTEQTSPRLRSPSSARTQKTPLILLSPHMDSNNSNDSSLPPSAFTRLRSASIDSSSREFSMTGTDSKSTFGKDRHTFSEPENLSRFRKQLKARKANSQNDSVVKKLKLNLSSDTNLNSNINLTNKSPNTNGTTTETPSPSSSLTLSEPSSSLIDPKLRKIDPSERQVVLVDPLDSTEKYWWPAMTVPKDEVEQDMISESLSENECIVRYFEDNKYSVVAFSDLVILDPKSEFFISFKNKLQSEFLEDKGVDAALKYLNFAVLPEGFIWRKWLEKTNPNSKELGLSPDENKKNKENIDTTDSTSPKLSSPSEYDDPIKTNSLQIKSKGASSTQKRGTKPPLKRRSRIKTRTKSKQKEITNGLETNKHSSSSSSSLESHSSITANTSTSSSSSQSGQPNADTLSFDIESYENKINLLTETMANLHYEYKKVFAITSQLAKEIWLINGNSLPSAPSVTRQARRRRNN